MRKTLYISIFLFTLCLVSCKDDVKTVAQKPRIFPEYNVALDEIIRSKDGVIRGVDLNSQALIITKAETKQPSEVDLEFLYFEYDIDNITNY